MAMSDTKKLTFGKLVLGLIVALVGLWLLFNVIIPTVLFAIKVVVTLAVFGAVIWLVYRVMNYGSDKS